MLIATFALAQAGNTEIADLLILASSTDASTVFTCASEGGEQRFRVHVRPHREGAGTFVVTFHVAQHCGKLYPVPVTLSYIAETPIREAFHAQ